VVLYVGWIIGRGRRQRHPNRQPTYPRAANQHQHPGRHHIRGDHLQRHRKTAWTDSLGTAQDGRDFSAGRVALGSKLGRSFLASNGWTLTPDVGLYGDWRFQSDTALPTGTAVANIGAGWSGRVTAELSAKALNGCAVSLDGEYGGLGTNYKIWTGQVRGSVPF
jgi:hypothetical protein